MKDLKAPLSLFAFAIIVITLPACKAKKAAVKQQTQADTTTKLAPPPEAPPAAAPVETKPEPAPAPEKPDLNFSNIQFEFNSAILKTGSYETLDHVAAEIKKARGTNFVLNGNSSAEGTAEHNMSLSVDRANAVKAYLVNAGVDGNLLTTKGYGESKPLTSNTTEEGRALNRRVEIKPLP